MGQAICFSKSSQWKANYGAGYLCLAICASPVIQHILLAGVVLDVGIEVEVRAHGVAQPVLIGQRAPGSTRDRRPTPRGKTMGQAICFSPLNPLRLGVLSEAGVRY